MTKKRHTASRMLLALVALTLVSFCFLGSTFARYTTTGTGTATTQVAKWEITATDGFVKDAAAVTFAKLSPSMDAWADGETRSHSTALTKVASITNSGDVDALVTLAADETAKLKNGTEEVTTVMGDEAPYAFDINHAKARFTIKFYWSKTNNLTLEAQATPYGDPIELAPEATVYIYAVVTWTSLDSEGAAFADALDTWIGENITEVSWGLSYTAVQNTELPA